MSEELEKMYLEMIEFLLSYLQSRYNELDIKSQKEVLEYRERRFMLLYEEARTILKYKPDTS